MKTGECVHHKDLNKHNNYPENLVICDKKQHRLFHLQLEKIAVDLYRNGYIEFKDNKYFISDKLKEVMSNADE